MLRKISLKLIGVLFFIAGIMHFTHDTDLAAITPLPYSLEIVWLTGVMELIFALLILFSVRLKLIGWLLSAFCLAVLPANIYMAVYDIPMFGEHVDPWVLWLRIPMQFVIIAWILWATEAWKSAAHKEQALS